MTPTLERELHARVVELLDDNASLRDERATELDAVLDAAVARAAVCSALELGADVADDVLVRRAAQCGEDAATVRAIRRLLPEAGDDVAACVADLDVLWRALSALVTTPAAAGRPLAPDALGDIVRARLAERDDLRARLATHEALAAAVRAVVREHGASGRVATAADLAMVAALGDVDLAALGVWPASGITHAGRWWHRADGAWECVGPSRHGETIAAHADARRAMGTP